LVSKALVDAKDWSGLRERAAGFVTAMKSARRCQ
jgi:hypothetical protein